MIEYNHVIIQEKTSLAIAPSNIIIPESKKKEQQRKTTEQVILNKQQGVNQLKKEIEHLKGKY